MLLSRALAVLVVYGLLSWLAATLVTPWNAVAVLLWTTAAGGVVLYGAGLLLNAVDAKLNRHYWPCPDWYVAGVVLVPALVVGMVWQGWFGQTVGPLNTGLLAMTVLAVVCEGVHVMLHPYEAPAPTSQQRRPAHA